MSYASAQGRALQDTLQAERTMRDRSEKTVRGLVKLLEGVIARLPSTKEATQNPKKVEKESAVKKEKEELEPLPLPPKLQTTSKKQVRGKKKPKPKKRSPEIMVKVNARIEALGDPAKNTPEGFSGSMATVLADLQKMQKSDVFVKKPPAAWQQRLSGKGRTGRDLSLAYERYWSTLWLIGRWSIVSKLEIETLIGLSNGLSTRAGSLVRASKDMVEANLLLEKSMRLSKAPSSALKIYTLSEEGKTLFKLLFKKRAVQDELAIMNEKHEGERFPDHTLAVLIFALHARRRGWATQLMPSVEGKAAPDLVILRGDECLYVEVERGQKEKSAKWTGIASLNEGTVALCAMTEKYRQRLVGDCKLLKIKAGLATDLKSLVTVRYDDIGAETALWLKKW
ncbi:MAG: hypothetical protein B6I38_00650 [Anaerolineaceae bacterium 4572_5.1]|nr:MAG: hypothetical protein B6I38_00650 [Anaerolineaceae bacterium 4572_5.1]